MKNQCLLCFHVSELGHHLVRCGMTARSTEAVNEKELVHCIASLIIAVPLLVRSCKRESANAGDGAL